MLAGCGLITHARHFRCESEAHSLANSSAPGSGYSASCHLRRRRTAEASECAIIQASLLPSMLGQISKALRYSDRLLRMALGIRNESNTEIKQLASGDNANEARCRSSEHTAGGKEEGRSRSKRSEHTPLLFNCQQKHLLCHVQSCQATRRASSTSKESASPEIQQATKASAGI